MRFLILFVALLSVGCGEEHDDAPTSPSADDQALVAAQKTCPVSGKELGSMGAPLKMTVGDKTVFLCCKGCVKEFKQDPRKYLAMTPQGGK